MVLVAEHCAVFTVPVLVVHERFVCAPRERIVIVAVIQKDFWPAAIDKPLRGGGADALAVRKRGNIKHGDGFFRRHALIIM